MRRLMAGGARQDGGIIQGINVTPLVDITLVLLVIFIVTAKVVVTPAVPLDLPQATQAGHVQVVFSVLLAADGRVFVNGTPAQGLEMVETQAREALAADDELRAVIQADGDVSHRQVIAALDAVERAGVTRIAFGALPEAPSEVTP